MADENWIRLLGSGDLPEGEMVGIDVGDSRLAVYNVDGTFHVTDNICTHAFAILSDGWFEDGVVECPLHGGRFDVRSGEAVAEPAECPLRIYAVRIVDGEVQVLLQA